MNKITQFINRYWALLFLFLSWLVVTLYNIKVYWMIIDDGFDVVFSRELFENIASLNLSGISSQLFEYGGRFRPVYWVYHTLVWLVGRNSYEFHHLAHMVVIGATMLFIYLIILELTKSKELSFFGALFYLLIPINSENIIRIGPQEPQMTLFVSILVYLIIKNRRMLLPVLFLTLAMFTKEVSIALFPVIFLYFILSKNREDIKNKKQGFYLLISAGALSFLVILIAMMNRHGYSTYYHLDSSLFLNGPMFFFKEIFTDFMYTFPALAIIFLFRLSIKFVKKKKIQISITELFEIVFLGGFICFFLIQIPWKFVLTRYLMPAIFFLMVFTFTELREVLKYFGSFDVVKKNNKVFARLLIFTGFYISLIWGINLVSRTNSTISYYKTLEKMSIFPENSYVLANMPEGESTIEIVTEIDYHLSEFWARDDIKVEYLNLEKLPKDNYIVIETDSYPRKYTSEKLVSILGNTTSIHKESSSRLILTTPPELLKQGIKKLVSFIIHRKNITPDGIYTYSYDYNNWYFYNE